MESLVGGAGSDTFKVTPPVIPPVVPLTIDGQDGVSDVLNFNGDPAIFTNTGTSITTIAGAPPPVYINHSNLEVVNIVLGPFSLLPPAPNSPEASPVRGNEAVLPIDPAIRVDPEPSANGSSSLTPTGAAAHPGGQSPARRAGRLGMARDPG